MLNSPSVLFRHEIYYSLLTIFPTSQAALKKGNTKQCSMCTPQCNWYSSLDFYCCGAASIDSYIWQGSVVAAPQNLNEVSREAEKGHT